MPIHLALLLFLFQQAPSAALVWALVFGLLYFFIGGGVLISRMDSRMLAGGKARTSEDQSSPSPSTDNPSAFMTASMQAVIQKLRDQEKELAALHRRDRERARQTERLSEAVTRNMPAGLLLIGAVGIITSANPAAEIALGVQTLVYRRYSEVFGAESTLTRLIGGCLSEGNTYRREEVEYATPQEELRRLGVTISPILGPEGKVTGALCLLSDLTEFAALQRQVQVKESMAALGELSAGIAHEFKNALATISGYAQMIRSESTGDVAENSQRILEQTRSLAHVVTEFLKFARPMDLSHEDVDVASLIGRVVDEVLEVVPQVEIGTSGEFGNLSGDEALLRQALLNLIRNAAEAASAHSSTGRVGIHGTTDHIGDLPAQRISISDNGPGIPKDDLNKIFVPFYTTKAQGTGLGLAIVQKIVVQHGGTVEVRNQPQGGAEFIVWLPFVRDAGREIDSANAGI